MDSTLPWVEKYRPKHLSDVLGHDEITQSIQRMISNNNLQHMIFFGPPGTGKTSTISAAANELYGNLRPVMVMEKNVSVDRGIVVIRKQILKFISTSTSLRNKIDGKHKEETKYLCKLIILDEADAMTVDAQDALRSIMEDYIDNARFVLICNQIAKLREAIQSRCMKLRFAPINHKNMIKKIKEVCKIENISISDDGIETLMKKSNGDMRIVLNNLQSIPKLKKCVLTEPVINEYLNHPTNDDIKHIYDIINNHKLQQAVYQLKTIVRKHGFALQDIISAVHELLMNDMQIDLKKKYKIIEQLAQVEIYLSGNTNEKIQLVAMVSCFKC